MPSLSQICTFDRISCRQSLNAMVITGFMLNYALRVNLPLAIVAMTAKTNIQNVSQLAMNNVTTNTSIIVSEALITSSNVTLPVDTTTSTALFDWDEYEQNLIHGSFFWGYILTELPGGRMAELIGGRRVFGHSMLWASILTLFTPGAAMIDYKIVILVRALLGFMLGASWPAIHPMTAVWIAPMDRSKFMANMMASSLGAAISMPLCGFLISYVGWQSVFYVTGGIALFWSIIWFLIIFETPATHPRISAAERNEIEEAIGTSTSKKRPSHVPWKQLLTSSCVWAIIITHGASVFGFFTVVNQLPTYMSKILGFNIKKNGALSSLPYLGKYIMAVLASALADHLRKTGRFTTTQVRKMFTAFAVMTPGFLMIAQVFYGYDPTFAVIIFTLQLLFNGAVTAGYLGNGLDIAPNFSGTIFGLANTLSSFSGFVSSFMVGSLTLNNQTYGQWQIVFAILAATYIIGSFAFLLMGTGELQSWNSPPEEYNIEKNAEEGVPLKTLNTKKQ